jgi:hypothetical protein
LREHPKDNKKRMYDVCHSTIVLKVVSIIRNIITREETCIIASRGQKKKK